MKDNKYLKIAGVAFVVIALIVATFFIGDKDNGSGTSGNLSNDADTIFANAQAESAAVSEKEKKAYNKIDVATYLDYYEASEAKLILLGRDGCPYCQIANPIIQNIAYTYDIEINYLDVDEFTEETQTAFVQSDEEFSSGFGTPFLFIAGYGQIIDKVDGLTDKAHYIDFLKAYGYIH